MSLGPTRTAKLMLWTTATVAWSWAAVATIATRGTQPGGATPEDVVEPLPVAQTVAPAAALPAGDPGSVLVLRLSRPVDPEVIVRREYVTIPAPAPAPASRPAAPAAPPPQRSAGS